MNTEKWGYFFPSQNLASHFSPTRVAIWRIFLWRREIILRFGTSHENRMPTTFLSVNLHIRILTIKDLSSYKKAVRKVDGKFCNFTVNQGIILIGLNQFSHDSPIMAWERKENESTRNSDLFVPKFLGDKKSHLHKMFAENIKPRALK